MGSITTSVVPTVVATSEQYLLGVHYHVFYRLGVYSTRTQRHWPRVAEPLQRLRLVYSVDSTVVSH